MEKKVITRFAPSPTGYLHVGGLRTALYAFLFAKKHSGKFLLRIEDTDQTRLVADADVHLQAMLKIFGLKWDNRTVVYQSKRLEKYQQAAQQLMKRQHAYLCFCTPERLDQMRQEQIEKKIAPHYDGRCAELTSMDSQRRIAKGETHVVRLRVTRQGVTRFVDAVRGTVEFKNDLIDEPVLLKSDGYPTYHLASVVDDHEMKISHVIRGEEWLSSTPKHLLLYQMFGWKPPEFAHLPLLLNPDKTKLSKRQGDVAVEEYLKKGYLPEALLNFVLLLGWNPGTNQELFGLDEMKQVFDFSGVNKSGAVFDTQKLDWLNGHYLRSKTPKEFTKLCLPYLKNAGIITDGKNIKAIVQTEQNRVKILSEIVEATAFFFSFPEYDVNLLRWKETQNEQLVNNLQLVYTVLRNVTAKTWQAKQLEKALFATIKERQLNNGEVLWPLRVALTGRKASPGPFEVAAALGKKESLHRIQHAIQKIGPVNVAKK